MHDSLHLNFFFLGARVGCVLPEHGHLLSAQGALRRAWFSRLQLASSHSGMFPSAILELFRGPDKAPGGSFNGFEFDLAPVHVLEPS